MKKFDFNFGKNFKDLDNEKVPKELPKFGKYIKYVVLAIIIVFVINDGFYNVSEQENAVVSMFGKVVRTDTAGLYFKIPVLQKVKYVDITTHGTGVGYTLYNNGQNITD